MLLVIGKMQYVSSIENNVQNPGTGIHNTTAIGSALAFGIIILTHPLRFNEIAYLLSDVAAVHLYHTNELETNLAVDERPQQRKARTFLVLTIAFNGDSSTLTAEERSVYAFVHCSDDLFF